MKAGKIQFQNKRPVFFLFNLAGSVKLIQFG